MLSIADMSIIELRGLPTEGLGPGSRITIGNKEYEYYDSDDDDSIDDSPGPGRTLYKLIKRVSAPVEMFITKSHRSRSSFEYKRKHSGIYYWTLNLHPNIPWLDIHYYRRAARLVDFVIDSRYAFSVRLTAAYYLTLVLAYISLYHRHTILRMIPLIYEALELIHEDGCRKISFARHSRPLYDLLLCKR
ncbi:hypothetical protein NEOLEDRAFT_1246528, partial [Neolentinus lepideus HHB14362 ss-1]